MGRQQYLGRNKSEKISKTVFVKQFVKQINPKENYGASTGTTKVLKLPYKAVSMLDIQDS